MKILMINVVCGIRSTGRICTDLATALEAQGHDVKIAYGRETVPAEFQKYAVKIGSNFDVKMHGIKARLFDAAGFGSKRATKKLIKWVKEYDPDVIHLHNIHGYYINIEILFAYLKTCGKKIVWTLHDCWAFTGHSAYCDMVNCEKWINGCNHCPQIRIYPKSFVDRSETNWLKKKKLLQNVPNLTIVTPSQWLADLVKQSFLSDYKVSVIHNGIDTSVFKPTESNFREKYGIKDKYIILGVSTAWSEMKGLSDYVNLAEALDESYQVVLVGVTAEQKKELPNKILTIERTNNIEELASIYSSSDLFVNLSYCENYPTVNLEAISCGTPVLTYKTGGSSESALGGVIVERGNLSKVIEIIKSKPSMNEKLVFLSLDKSISNQKYISCIIN